MSSQNAVRSGSDFSWDIILRALLVDPPNEETASGFLLVQVCLPDDNVAETGDHGHT
jgi:hypothetical protein